MRTRSSRDMAILARPSSSILIKWSSKEVIVARKYIDCREFPSQMNCTIAISADSEEELLEAAVQHAVAVHGHADSPEFRNQLRGIFKEGTPPLKTA
jgi:predicted small metal-binding protein